MSEGPGGLEGWTLVKTFFNPVFSKLTLYSFLKIHFWGVPFHIWGTPTVLQKIRGKVELEGIC